MSAPPSGGGTPIENRRQLIEYFAAGNKPRAQWRMGTEHEKFGYHTKTLKPLAYDGPDGIRAMLEGLTRFGWEPVIEGNNPIALLRGKASITLEPGGQFELSGAALSSMGGASFSLVPARPGKGRRTTFLCAKCERDIPPGKPGRSCKACRESEVTHDNRL